MSAFLGPIHFWLYHKIQFQESLIDELIRYASAQGWSDGNLADTYGSKDRRNLEEVIDESTTRKAVTPPWFSLSPTGGKTA